MKKQDLFVLGISIILFASCNRELGEIAITGLPTAITNYVKTNYTDYTIDEAQKDTLCNGIAGIEVELEKKGAADISLFFNNENAFILKEEDIKYSTLPTNVSAFISNNYPNYEMPKKAEKITLADGTIQYEVDLKEKTTKIEKEVLINAEGTSKICEH